MCGIAGFWLVNPADHSEHTVRNMTDAIQSRGPDSNGAWRDDSSTCFLGHRRLAIQDLSIAGSQPMSSESNRYIVVFNGEIYNHQSIREKIANQESKLAWKGSSDTETLLAAIERWGIAETLNCLNGMFAFALWDTQLQRLHLARDRMGEKPLYYGEINGTFVFGSELRALRKYPGFVPEIDRQSVAQFLSNSNIPAPRSIYVGIKKLPAGSWLELASPDLREAKLRKYWDLSDLVRNHSKSKLREIESPEEALDLLRAQLQKSVSSRMLSDVPLGAFLSGGYDSSLVTALMQQHSMDRIQTFSIGFNEAAFDEAPHAKSVARILGTDHQELYVDDKQSLELVPRLAEIWDEPFSDPSQIPTYLLSEMTRRHVKVAISGDGGDELFGGYSRYLRAISQWDKCEKIPPFLLKVAGSSTAFVSSSAHMALASVPGLQGSRALPFLRVLEKPADTLSKANMLDTYLHKTRHWKEPDKLVIGVDSVDDDVDRALFAELPSMLKKMSLYDATTYLPDTILTKVDRASMAVSLETRAPLLDHELVELSIRLSDSLKVRDGTGKWVLRELTHEFLPIDVMDRPKMGFGVPIEHWLRGVLREWASDLLSESRIKRQGIFKPEPVQRIWREHLSGQWNWEYYLWDVLMFQQWMDTYHK